MRTLSDLSSEEWAEGTVAIAYSPNEAYFALRVGEVWMRCRPNSGLKTSPLPVPEETDFLDCFEVIFFNADKQVRWMHRSQGNGVEFTLNDKNAQDTDKQDGDESSTKVFERNYLLHGVVNDKRSTKGWVCLEEGRIGAYMVPFSDKCESEDRLCFNQKNFADRDDQGNFYLAASRLVSIKKYAPDSNQGKE